MSLQVFWDDEVSISHMGILAGFRVVYVSGCKEVLFLWADLLDSIALAYWWTLKPVA